MRSPRYTTRLVARALAEGTKRSQYLEVSEVGYRLHGKEGKLMVLSELSGSSDLFRNMDQVWREDGSGFKYDPRIAVREVLCSPGLVPVSAPNISPARYPIPIAAWARPSPYPGWLWAITPFLLRTQNATPQTSSAPYLFPFHFPHQPAAETLKRLGLVSLLPLRVALLQCALTLHAALRSPSPRSIRQLPHPRCHLCPVLQNAILLSTADSFKLFCTG